jgi:hypothetical protein
LRPCCGPPHPKKRKEIKNKKKKLEISTMFWKNQQEDTKHSCTKTRKNKKIIKEAGQKES